MAPQEQGIIDPPVVKTMRIPESSPPDHLAEYEKYAVTIDSTVNDNTGSVRGNVAEALTPSPADIIIALIPNTNIDGDEITSSDKKDFEKVLKNISRDEMQDLVELIERYRSDQKSMTRIFSCLIHTTVTLPQRGRVVPFKKALETTCIVLARKSGPQTKVIS